MLQRKHDTHEHMANGTAKKQRKMHKNSENPEETRRKIQHENKNTWASPDGKIQRQIDYIMINQRYRNAVRKSMFSTRMERERKTTEKTRSHKNGHKPKTTQAIPQKQMQET